MRGRSRGGPGRGRIVLDESDDHERSGVGLSLAMGVGASRVSLAPPQ